jgi:GTP-binding protein Era
MNKSFKKGKIALLGRPNAGKSTLLNALLDVDFSAVSDRPQTTRKNIRGILQTHDEKGVWDGELVVLDTPGINFQRGLLERSMHMAVQEALDECDVAIWLADAKSFQKDLSDIQMQKGGEDKIPFWIDQQLRENSKAIKWIVVLNKCDSLETNEVLPLIQKTTEVFPQIKDVVPISAVYARQYNKSNIDTLIKVLKGYCEEGIPEYKEDHWTDLSEKGLIENLIREAVFQLTRKEVPYFTDSNVVSFETPQAEGLRKKVGAVIWISKKSLKPILVGSQGSKIKEIGIYVRKRQRKNTSNSI